MQRIFLIGMMGSGKSFWARKIAAAENLACYDLDLAIEQQEGKTIAEIFSSNGEEYFRNMESKALHSFENRDNFVLATGGGAPCYHGNMQWMNEQGVTIWIDEPVEILVERLAKEKDHRPLLRQLSVNEMADYLQKKLDERFTYYSLAKHRLKRNDLEKDLFWKELLSK